MYQEMRLVLIVSPLRCPRDTQLLTSFQLPREMHNKVEQEDYFISVS
jgi:hypothetical protein